MTIIERQLSQEARVLRALSHPARLAIVAFLRNGAACVCHLGTALGRSEPYVSQQLAVLRHAGLVTKRRKGTFAYYELQDYAILGVLDLTAHYAGERKSSAGPAGQTRIPGCDCPACQAAEGEEVA
ncbi:MAG: metalloregulator ArsR/SmtB family transcription factor [Armatimonadota bacterium]|nr:metalloregulator ArsR/SmtB family transcription factor [Armatimonadota bacterium]